MDTKGGDVCKPEDPDKVLVRSVVAAVAGAAVTIYCLIKEYKERQESGS